MKMVAIIDGCVVEEMGWSFGAFRLASGMPIEGDILIPLVVFTLTRAWGHYTVIHMDMCETSYD
jgi:hypothetical protein